MIEEELRAILKSHKLWLESDGQEGERAYLYKANLREVNLRGEDLSEADLREADLRGANLKGANLQDADLCSAILEGACLEETNLNGAELSWVVGNGEEIKTIQTERWPIVYTSSSMAIGCEQHLLLEWFNYRDEEVAKMHREALKFWHKWKPILESIGVFGNLPSWRRAIKI